MSLAPKQHPPLLFRAFQKEDLARAACVDGAIIAWEPGLGKTWAMIFWPWLKAARRVLIVAPADLHPQIAKEIHDLVGASCHTINTIEDAETLGLTRPLALEKPRHTMPEGELPPLPDYYITAYNWLGNTSFADEWARTTKTTRKQRKKAHPLLNDEDLDEPYRNVGHAKDRAGDIVEADVYADDEIACIAHPTLGRVLEDAFDCVVCDEAVRLKNLYALQAQGVFRIRARYRLALSGTPIKNSLPDVFMLCWWVSGGTFTENPRWPYIPTSSSIGEFCREHLVMEENVTRSATHFRETGENRTFIKATNKICHVHRLWKLLGPNVIRRTKQDVAGDMPSKTIAPIMLDCGKHQRDTYQWHVHHKPEFNKAGKKMNWLSQIGVQLMNLRQASTHPASPNLTQRSAFEITMKAQALFNLTIDKLSEGEQFIIFSPFQEFNEMMTRRLGAAGVRAARLDGSATPKRRGKIVDEFKQKKWSVLVCGINAMSEGHSLHCCSNLAIVSLDWACDKNLQAIDRVHRLTSQKPVTIYLILTKRTIDMRLQEVWNEKGDSQNLAIDGQLIEDKYQEVNLASLLHDALADAQEEANGEKLVNEADLSRSWETTRKSLAEAQAAFEAATAIGNATNAEPEAIPVAESARNWSPPVVQIDHSQSARDRIMAILQKRQQAA